MFLKFTMVAGETRHIKVQILSRAGQDFSVENATYTIYRGETLIEQGDTLVSNNQLDVMFSTACEGAYLLTHTFSVGDEVRVVKVAISVV